MSKNNKQRQRIALRKTRNRKNGFKGPKSTTPCHGKKKAWYQLKDSNGVLLIFSKRDAEAKAKAEKAERSSKKEAKAKPSKRPSNKRPAANDATAIAA